MVSLGSRDRWCGVKSYQGEDKGAGYRIGGLPVLVAPISSAASQPTPMSSTLKGNFH